MTMTTIQGEGGKMTLLELVTAVQDDADTDAEVVATVTHLVNSGMVRLCGNFAGAYIDLDETGESHVAAA